MNNTKGKMHYAWVILISVCAITLGVMGTVGNSIGVFNAAVMEDLGVGLTAVSLYFTVRTLVMAVFQSVAGRIFKKFDVRLVISVACVLAIGGMMICAGFHHIIGWYISAAVSGIGLAFICYLMAPILLGNWFKDKLGTVMGIAFAFNGIGGMIFSTVAAKLIASVGFRMAYIYLGLIGLVISLPFAILGLRSTPKEKGFKIYGFANSSSNEDVVADDTGLTTAETFKTAPFYLILIVILLMNIAACFQSYIATYVVTVGLDTVASGVVSSIMMFGLMIGQVLMGVLADKFSVKMSACTACIIGIAGFGMLLMIGGPGAFAYCASFVFGLISGCFLAVLPPLLIKDSFGNKGYTDTFSLCSTFAVLASAASGMYYGRLYDTTGSFNASMVGVIIMLVVSFVFVIIGNNAAKKLWKK